MKYALVTGGTKGIGKAISHALLSSGYKVIINYSSDDLVAQSVYDDFDASFPGQLQIIKADLSKIDSVRSFCDQVITLTKKLDLLILNAGKTDRTSFPNLEYETMISVFNANVFVPFFLIQNLIEIMPKGASIISIGSDMGAYPHSVSISYGVSKSSLHALTKNLVKFLRPFGVRINTIAPGFVNTDWHRSKSDELKEKIKNKIALNRFCEPHEVADMVKSLIDNQYLNGQIIKLDGGYNFE